MQITSTTPHTVNGQAVTPPPAGWHAIESKPFNPLRRREPRELPSYVLNSTEAHIHDGKPYPCAFIHYAFGFNRQGQFVARCSLSRLDKDGFGNGYYSYHSMPLSEGWSFTYLIAPDVKEPARYTVNAKAQLVEIALANIEPLYQYASTIKI